MIRQLKVRDHDGTAYDVDRARREGLVEELMLTHDGRPVPLTEELVEALGRALDLGVNVPPGTVQTADLELWYEYRYGRVES